jgi:trimeric autotransporter adhesin
MTGAGLALSGGPVTLSPSSLTFSLAGIPQPVTVTNNGTTPVEIGSIAVTTTGNVVSGFAETNNCGSTLAAQSICTVSVQTGSLTVSGFAGTLTVIDSAASGTQTLPLSVPASVNFSASPFAFGSWALGVTSPDQTAGANSGSYYNPAPPVFISITGPNASDFAYSFPSVAPGCGSNYECYADITFTPGGLGARTATLVTNYGNIALSGNGIPDGPSFTIASYSGPEETVGSSSPPTLLAVVNNGYTPLVLSGISVTGANASDFAVTSQCNSTLSTAASCNLSIVFTPSQAGLRTATLTVTDATSGVSNTIPLTGIGDPLAPTVTPNILTFGNTEVGVVSTAQSATISAPNGDPVAITYIGDPGNSFLVSPGTCATQTPCQVSVSFQPSSTGRLYSLYQVTDNVTSKFTYLSLLGTGGVATVSLSAASLTFAARDEATTSIPQTVTLTNTGDASLTISLVSFIGANTGDFSIQGNTCGSSVASGANCAISISFSPAASGTRNATLQIMSNAASSPDTVQLSGTGQLN